MSICFNMVPIGVNEPIDRHAVYETREHKERVMDQHNKSTTFSAEDHLDFLRSLANDPAVRAELQAQPASTLAKYGIEFDAASLPTEISLPEASDIENEMHGKSLAELLTHWFPFLDGGLEN